MNASVYHMNVSILLRWRLPGGHCSFLLVVTLKSMFLVIQNVLSCAEGPAVAHASDESEHPESLIYSRGWVLGASLFFL